METRDNLTITLFESPSDWQKWLASNFEQNKGLWLKLSKKGATYPSITYAEALDIALCYGWIDSQKQSYDDSYFLQKFTQRRSKSIWSKANIEHINRLTEAGRMKPAGQAEVNKAKADGRWERAYDGSRSIKMTPGFAAALEASPVAKAFYDTLNRSSAYSILWHLQTATSAEVQDARVRKFIAMLERGEVL